MSLPQRKFREVLFQWLYSYSFGVEDKEQCLLCMQELRISKSSVKKVVERAHDVIKHFDDIDEKISSVTKGYDLDRIQRVEMTILRLAVYELFYDDEIPKKVVISEAVRMARKFSTPESGSFVNGILDAL